MRRVILGLFIFGLLVFGIGFAIMIYRAKTFLTVSVADLRPAYCAGSQCDCSQCVPYLVSQCKSECHPNDANCHNNCLRQSCPC